VEDNLAALEVKPFSPDERARLRRFYEDEVLPHIRGAY